MKILKWPNFVFQYMTVKRQSEDDRRAARRWLASRTSEAGWRPVLVFPEGTNTNGKAIIQFKGGAFSVIYFDSFGPGLGSFCSKSLLDLSLAKGIKDKKSLKIHDYDFKRRFSGVEKLGLHQDSIT